MSDYSNLSLEEDKSDWQYWLPHYPQDFCEEILLSFTSHIDDETKKAKEFLEHWPWNWKASKEDLPEQPEYIICQHCGNETCHFECEYCCEDCYPVVSELQKKIPDDDEGDMNNNRGIDL